jgi:hypothetical protein
MAVDINALKKREIVYIDHEKMIGGFRIDDHPQEIARVLGAETCSKTGDFTTGLYIDCQFHPSKYSMVLDTLRALNDVGMVMEQVLGYSLKARLTVGPGLLLSMEIKPVKK